MELDEHEEGEVTLPPPVPVSVSYDRPRTKSMTPSSRDHFSARKLQVKYRECLRNHAVGIGGHATDGCGEFMPAGEEGTIDALKCAACNCHRNFHRREGDHGSELFTPSPHSFYRSLPVAGGYVSTRTVPHPLPLHPQPLHANNVHHLHHREEQEEEVVDHHGGNGGTGSSDGGGGSGVMTGKKRFRTKFTQDQKERMLEFAEKLGWRIQKHDEEAVQRFCMETGVRRHVLKVWMHNNKHTLGKKSLMHEGGGGGGDLPCSDKVYNSSEEDGPKI